MHMDILSHSKKTALDNKVDVAYYIINYIDHGVYRYQDRYSWYHHCHFQD